MSELMRLGYISTLACALALPAYGADDPFAGAWKLNAAKSKLQTGPRSATIRIEIDATNIRLDLEGTDDQGAPFKLTVRGSFDDSFYRVANSSHFDAVTFRRTESRHILAEMRKSGTVVEWVDAEVSGNTLKVSLTSIDAKSKEIKSLAVLQRE